MIEQDWRGNERETNGYFEKSLREIITIRFVTHVIINPNGIENYVGKMINKIIMLLENEIKKQSVALNVYKRL